MLLKEQGWLRSAIALVLLLLSLLALRHYLEGRPGAAPDEVIDEKISLYLETVCIGKDIFSLKRELEEKGFRIENGPAFATEAKDYYLMWVDFGDTPSRIETLKYVVWGTSGKSSHQSGLIRANAERQVTEFSPNIN